MKSILTVIFSFLFIVSGFSQTRNVVVGTNDVIISPTNFWNANATNARTGLGLGTAATNPASAFQPASTVLSNLASSNGASLTNIAVSNVVGALATNGNAINLTNFPASLLMTNGNGFGLTNLNASNITGTLSLTSGGTGATNASDARNNLGLGTAATNPATSFQPSSSVLSNLASGNGINLTNIQATNIVGTISVTNIAGSSYSNNIQNFVSDVSNATNTVTNSRNVTVYSIFPTVNTITNTVQLPTNSAVVGDLAKIIHTGPTNSLTRIKKIGEITNLFTLNQASESVDFIYDGTNWAILPNNSQTTPIYFSGNNATSNAAISRINLGLGWSALTNSNAGTGLVSVDSNGSVVSPTNFWQAAPIASNLQTIVQTFSPTTNSTNAATNGRNIYVYSLSTNVSGITNIVTLPTNAATIAGDNVTITHQGLTNSTTAIRQLGATNNLITINNLDEAVKFIYENGAWTFYHNISYVEPIRFSGTNAAANAAASRTNLGLGATWLTNTNVTNFRTAIGLGATNDVSFREATFSGQVTITGDVFGGSFEASDGTNVVSVQKNGIQFNGTAAATTRTNLGLGWPALTNSNESEFLLGFTNNPAENTNLVGAYFVGSTRDTVVYNRSTLNTNILPITNQRNILAFTNEIAIGNRRILSNGTYGLLTFDEPIDMNNVGGDSIRIQAQGSTNSSERSIDIVAAGQAGGIVSIAKRDGLTRLWLGQASDQSTNPSVDRDLHNVMFRKPFNFTNNIDRAISRTNLQLGATNDVTFSRIIVTEGQTTNVSIQLSTNSQTGFLFGGVSGGRIGGYIFGNPVFLADTNSSSGFRIFAPLYFGDSTNTNQLISNASITRTNLGLGATNEVTFGKLYISNTNVGVFEGLANLINSNNTTLSNETLFRVGLAEATNRSAQFGFRVARTNNGGEGLAVFSVYGYNALMMIGPSDRSRTNTATNAAIEADIYSISPTNKVMTLITTNTGATLFHRAIEFENTTNQATTRTNLGLGLPALTNTNNANFQAAVFNTNTTPAGASFNSVVAWMEVHVFTNGSNTSFRVPLFK